jgi:hypothetical protein
MFQEQLNSMIIGTIQLFLVQNFPYIQQVHIEVKNKGGQSHIVTVDLHYELKIISCIASSCGSRTTDIFHHPNMSADRQLQT